MTANVLSRSAIASHMAIDVGDAQENIIEMLFEIKGCLPYLTRGTSIQEEREKQREALVEEYKEYVRSQFETEEEFQEYMRKRNNG